MTDASAPTWHIEQVLRLAKDLAEDGITLYRYEYHPLAFGSFIVEFGRSHYRVLCEWNGKGSILSVSFAEARNQSGPLTWIHDADIIVSPPDVFAEIGSQVLAMVTG